MSLITCKNRRGGGNTLSYLFSMIVMLGLVSKVSADVIDLEGQTVGKFGGSDFKNSYAGNTIINGTVQVGSLAEAVGVYTIGDGAVVTCGDQQYINGDCTFNIVEGGEYKQTGSYFVYPFRYGQVKLIMNGGKFTSTSTASALSRGGMVNFGYVWNNQSSSKGKDVSAFVVMTNRSELSISSGNLQLGSVKSNNEAGSPVKTSKTDLFVTNSIIKCEKGQIVLACSVDKWLSDWNNSYVRAVFGPNSEITTGQFYVNGQYPQSSVIFDGATIHWTGNNTSFIGHTTAVGDVYTIDSLGLTIDIPSGKSLTCDQNASSLKGEGGITKIGEGSITWNKVSSNGSQGMTFTGPLTVTEGTWSSSLGYASKVFNVSGEGSILELSGALSADEINFNVSEGGLLKLTGATTPNDTAPDMSISAGGVLEDVSTEPRTFSALALGEGCAVKVAGSADGVVGILADELALFATEENQVILKFSSATEIPVGTYAVITINGGGTFAEGDDRKFSLEETVPENSQLTLSEDKKSLLLIVPATNPATWIGNAGDGKFSTAGNWLGEKVPGADDEIDIKAATDIELECDIPIAVKAISIHPESAKVTINGAGSITLSEKIVNASEKMMTVNVPVEFKTAEGGDAAIDVTGEVDFQGGVKGTYPVNHSTFYGNYTLTATTWKLSSDIMIAAGATMTAPDMTIEPNGKLLNAESGSMLKIKQLQFNKNIRGNVFGTYVGELNVNKFYTYYPGGTLTFNNGFSGLFKCEYFHAYTAGNVSNINFDPAPSATIVMGGTGFESKTGWLKLSPIVVRSSGDWTIKLTKNDYTYSSVSQSVEINSGSFDIDTSDYDKSSVDGHTVTIVNKETKYAASADYLLKGGGALSAFGNGTLQFDSSANFTGGFTASNDVTVVVKKSVYPGKGDVTIRDTATLKLVDSASGTVPVAGKLTMEGGSTLHVPQFSASVVPISVNSLEFVNVENNKKVALKIDSGSLINGYNVILESDNAIPENAWSMIDVDISADGVSIPEGMETSYVTQGNTLCILVKGANDCIWTGSGKTATFSELANWRDGKTPSNGANLYIPASSDITIINDIENFSPASITFSAGSGAVTIDGEEAIKGIAAVTNLSSSVQEIACPLEFADNYRVHCSSKSVKFSGGATATYPASDMTDNAASRALTGNIMFTEDWTAVTPMSNKYTVPNGSRVYGKALIGSVENKTFLCVQNGGYAKFDSILTGKKLGRVSVQGELEVVNQWIAIATDNYSHIGEDNNSSETGVLRAGGLWKGDDERDMSKILYIKIKELYIGKDGLGAKQNDYYLRFDHDDGHVIHATDDFEIFGPLNSNNPHDWGLHLNGRNITFDTAGHTVLWTAGAQGSNGKVVKTGEGTLVMNPHGTTLSCAWSVDEGTLALAKNNATGSGAITVNTGAVLEVPSSTNVALGGDLTLKNGACLGFNYTTRNPPVLNLTDRNVTFEEGEATNIVVKISSSNGKRPYGGVNVLTSGGKFSGVTVSKAADNPDWVKDIYVDDNGNIVFQAKPIGTRIIVR